jgi:hypothetical protein
MQNTVNIDLIWFQCSTSILHQKYVNVNFDLMSSCSINHQFHTKYTTGTLDVDFLMRCCITLINCKCGSDAFMQEYCKPQHFHEPFSHFHKCIVTSQPAQLLHTAIHTPCSWVQEWYSMACRHPSPFVFIKKQNGKKMYRTSLKELPFLIARDRTTCRIDIKHLDAHR